MLTSALYSLIEYIDADNYKGSGTSLGKMAYDIKCMTEGKSTLGFLALNGLGENAPFISQAPLIASYDSNATQFINDKNNLTNVDGPKAFETFLENFWYSANQDFTAAAQCVVYSNQTMELQAELMDLTDSLYQESEEVFETQLKQFLTNVNDVIEDQLTSGCMDYVDQNLTELVRNAKTFLNQSTIDFSPSNSTFFPEPMIQINGTSYISMLNTFALQSSLIQMSQNSSTNGSMGNTTFPGTRNKWADFGRRVGALNLAMVMTNEQTGVTDNSRMMYWAVGASSLVMLSILVGLLVLKKKEKRVYFAGPPATEYSPVSGTAVN